MGEDIQKAIPSGLGQGLTDTERKTIAYCAAIGREFDFDVLMVSLDMGEETLADVLEGLVHKGLFRETRGGDHYLFIREEALAQILQEVSSSRMRVIHKKIAEAYEKLNPNPDAQIVPEMGRHFYLGKVHDKSMLYNRYSATIARNTFSPDVAIQYLERVKEDLAAMGGDHGMEESDILRELGDLYMATGEALKADDLYAKSLERLPPQDSNFRALILLSRAEAAREMDKLNLTRQYCEEAIRQFEKVGHRKGLAMAHRLLSRAANKEGKIELARTEIETTISLLDPVEDAKDLARCYIDIGNVYSSFDRPADQALAAENYRKALSVLEPLQDFREISRAHNNLAVLISYSNPREALKELGEARKYAEKAKDKRSVGWALFNSVEFLLDLGETSEAEKANGEADRILSKLDDPLGMQQVALNEGILAQHRKDCEAAEKHFRRSLKRAEDLGYPSIIMELHVRLANLFAECGKMGEAEREITLAETFPRDQLAPSVRPMLDLVKERLRNPKGTEAPHP